MTMSFLGADDTGYGIVVASSSPAVAARCAHLRSGIGVVATQNITDPRLGTAILDAMSHGMSPKDAIASVVESSDHIEYRQLAALGAHGSAHFTGERGLGINYALDGDQIVGTGNMLTNRDVITSAVSAFERTPGELEQRLMSTLTVAVEHGGEEGPLHSAGLMVTRRNRLWNETDLRIDWSDSDPVTDLSALLDRWMAERDDYITRALDPSQAPNYGVPGDL